MTVALTLLLGGARSGKSALAVRMGKAWGAPVVVIVTGEPRDEEMAEKIKRHRAARPPKWKTVEEPAELAQALSAVQPEASVIVDCLTLWVSNLIERSLGDEEIERRAREAASIAAARQGSTVAVSNEVGAGIVPGNALARRFRNLLGRVNAIWAEAAELSLFMVAGRALPLFDPETALRDPDG